METAQAFIIVIGFLVKMAGFGIFAKRLVTVVKWVRANVPLFSSSEDEDGELTYDPEWYR